MPNRSNHYRMCAATLAILCGFAVAPARGDQIVHPRQQFANQQAIGIADVSAHRPLTAGELEKVFRSRFAEARLLRLAILASERGESTTWLQLPPVVAGWPDVQGATHPILAALRAYLSSLQANGTLDGSQYLGAHGDAGYRAEVFVHWPTPRSGLRSLAQELGVDVEVVESATWVRLAKREYDEGHSLSVAQRVHDALALKPGGFPAEYRILELGQPGVDAFVDLYMTEEDWPRWTTVGDGRRQFIEGFVDVMTAWGDPRWALVTPDHWAEMSTVTESWLRTAIANEFGKTWPDRSREGLMLREFTQREILRRRLALPSTP